VLSTGVSGETRPLVRQNLLNRLHEFSGREGFPQYAAHAEGGLLFVSQLEMPAQEQGSRVDALGPEMLEKLAAGEAGHFFVEQEEIEMATSLQGFKGGLAILYAHDLESLLLESLRENLAEWFVILRDEKAHSEELGAK